jgi:hypothetical protein
VYQLTSGESPEWSHCAASFEAGLPFVAMLVAGARVRQLGVGRELIITQTHAGPCGMSTFSLNCYNQRGLAFP